MTDSVVGAEVTCPLYVDGERRQVTGIVVAYEPYGAAMCDVCVEYQLGAVRSCWVSSHECRFLDGSRLPERGAVRALRNRESYAQLLAIREQVANSSMDPWCGVGFMKPIMLQSLAAAIHDIEAELEPEPEADPDLRSVTY